MARKTITVDDDADIVDVTPRQIEGFVEEDISALRNDQAELEADMDAELGASENDVSYKISVFRIPDSGKELSYLFSIAGENFAGIRERLMDDYGTGYYSVQRFIIRPGIGARINKKYRVRIETPRKVAAPPAAADSALAAAVAKQGEILSMLVGQLAVMKQAPAAAPAPPNDFAGMAAMISAVKELLPAPPPPPPALSPFDMFGAVMGLVKELQDEGREKSVFDLAGDFIKSPLMEKVISGVQQQAPQPQPQLPGPQMQRPQPPQQMQQPPAPAPTPQAEQATDPTADLPSQLALLISGAAKNSDPVSYADVIADVMDPRVLESLIALPDPVGMLGQYHPGVLQYRAWFTELLAALTQEDDGGISETVNKPDAAHAPAADPVTSAAVASPRTA